MGLRDRFKQGLKRALGREPEAAPRVETSAGHAEAVRAAAVTAEAARVAAVTAEAARVAEAAQVVAVKAEAARVAAVAAESAVPVSPLPKNILSDNDAPLRDAHIRGVFATSGAGYVVHLVNEALGVDLRVPCEPGEFVLDAADRAGFELPSSCRTGGCLTCAAKLLGGETEMDEQYTLEEEHIADGFRLLCCTTVSSDATFISHQQDEIH